MLFAEFQFVTNQSMATVVTSKAISLHQVYGYAVQAVYTTSGTLGGTFTIEASVNHKEDPEGNILVPGDFAIVDDTAQLISGAGNWVWNLRSQNYSYFRLVYTPAGSDSGTLNAFASTKGV